jgi:hypothetical protein
VIKIRGALNVQQMHSDDSTPFASSRCTEQQITGPVDVSVLVRCSMYLLRETLPRGRENFDDVGRWDIQILPYHLYESIRETLCNATLALVREGRCTKIAAVTEGMD